MSQRIKFYVSKYIEGDPTIKVGLQRGLITTRILTKHIIEEEKEFRGSFDDVRNAVRTYNDEQVPFSNFNDTYRAFKDSHIDIRGKLAYIEINRNSINEGVFSEIQKFYLNGEKFVRLLNDEKSLILIAREDDIDKFIRLIERENVLSAKKNISSVTIYLDPSVKNIPGIYFLIMGQISLNNINVYDISSYKSEFIIYIDQKDVVKVHQLLYDLCEYQKKFCSPAGNISPILQN